MYGKEQTEQEAKIAAMREDDSKDEYDVRKQEEVLAETVAMIPDTRGRLERGHEDLEELLVRRRPAPLRRQHHVTLRTFAPAVHSAAAAAVAGGGGCGGLEGPAGRRPRASSPPRPSKRSSAGGTCRIP